jgi:hypothetical protein
MKNKTGIMSGFVLGSIGFPLLFKVLFLNHTPPEDELAPGIVVFAALMIGLASAFIGHLIQNYLRKERKV